MKTPAKKATQASAKASAKVAATSKKVSAKPPVKAKTAPAKPTPAKKAVVPAKVMATKAPAKKALVAKKAPAAKPVVAKKVSATQPVATKKPTPPAPKVAAKPVVKKAAVSSSSAKPPVKPVAKAGVKTSSAKKTAEPLKGVTPPKASAVSSVAVPPVVAAPAPAVPDLPARSSRPSARLAQITVPSLPPAVASTAAKASFLPSMTTAVLHAPAAPAKKDPKLANNWKTKPVDQLTDAEVLAMSDDDYMNDTQMAFFRLKLVALKQGILNNAGETTEHLREDTVVVPDPADRATIEEEHALELRTRDRERKLLKKIEQSIARIDAGDYGYCDETGEPIGVGRLLARPTATLSLEAQQRRELKQKMFGD